MVRNGTISIILIAYVNCSKVCVDYINVSMNTRVALLVQKY